MTWAFIAIAAAVCFVAFCLFALWVMAQEFKH